MKVFQVMNAKTGFVLEEHNNIYSAIVRKVILADALSVELTIKEVEK